MLATHRLSKCLLVGFKTCVANQHLEIFQMNFYDYPNIG